MGHPSSAFNLSIAQASSDARYYSRYPQGDKFSSVGNASGALVTVSPSAPAAVAIGGSTDSFGISTYDVQSLNTGINNGITLGNNGSPAFTASWDGTYAVLTWPTPGNSGLIYSFPVKARTQLYARVRVKAFQGVAAISKMLKMIGDSRGGGNPTSNFTLGPQLQGYAGGAPRALGLAYSDALGGGDNSVSWVLDGTLSGGGAYSRTPHPTFNVGAQTNLTANETLVEIFWKYNTDGNSDGEIAIWIDGVLKTWAVNVINCGTGLQKMDYVGVGELRGDSITGSLIELYRDFAISPNRPIGRGI
jgi:hypothetical protein